MKLRKVWITLLATVLLIGQLVFLAAAIPEIPFTDVPQNEWYYADVCNAYNMALIDGRSPTTFAPNELLTHAEAVKLAACMYQVYTDDAPFVVTAEPWYKIYADYCYEKGIISREYNWNQNITRAAYMDIFSRALPREALSAINTVDDGMIPDVPMSHRYAQSIYKLYRAGIVHGQDDRGTCAPDSYVKRSEVAAILTRMMNETKRIRIMLEDPANKPQTPEATQPVTPTPPDDSDNREPEFLPWEQPGAKQPASYSLDEYEALDKIYLKKFFEWFGTEEAFENWLKTAQLNAIYENLPWNNGGKKPDAYTWEEYEALSNEQRGKFFEWFGNEESYETWKKTAQRDAIYKNLPWQNGGKQPDAYTWAEYETLNNEQKEMFFAWFSSAADFERWMQNARGNTTGETLPWQNGGKQPDAYTWAEYEALNNEQQEMFFAWFSSAAEFERWMQNVRGNTTGETLPWQNGGKQPDAYTWAEYEALNNEQQEMFFAWFSSAADFERWMQNVRGNTTGEVLPWQNGGKQPDAYTWAEYEALTDTQKDYFFESFGSVAAFEQWYYANRPQ